MLRGWAQTPDCRVSLRKRTNPAPEIIRLRRHTMTVAVTVNLFDDINPRSVRSDRETDEEHVGPCVVDLPQLIMLILS